MSVIVGVTHDGTVYMAADTAASSEYVEIEITAPKIFVVGDVLIGVAGNTRATDLIRLGLGIGPETAGLNPHDRAHLICEAIRKLLRFAGFEAKAGALPTEVLIGIAGRLFSSSIGNGVLEAVEGFDAAGCGQEPALGSLFTTASLPGIDSPRPRVALAVHAAIHLNPRCGGRVFHAQLPETTS